MLKGFRDFIMRGNVVELAVAVVIGAAFSAVVSAFSAAFIQPLIKLLGGGQVDSATFNLTSEVVVDYGAFLNAVVGFFVTAAVVYFLFILPMKKIAERRARGQEPETPPMSDEIRLLTEIRDALVAGGNGAGKATHEVYPDPRVGGGQPGERGQYPASRSGQ